MILLANSVLGYVIPAKAGIQLSYQSIMKVLNIDITHVRKSLDSSFRWNDMLKLLIIITLLHKHR